MDYSHLLYKRGYLFSQVEVEPPVSGWTKKNIGDYFISFDPENLWGFSQTGDNWVALLGKAVDLLHWSMDVHAIVSHCLDRLRYSEERMLDYIDYLAGRFALIYHHGNKTRFMTDAFGTRSAFYSLRGPVMIASHCKIISDYLNLGQSKQLAAIKADPKWLDVSGHAYPGILTPYEEVYLLTPNTLINIEQRKIERFYPRKELLNRSLADVIGDVSTALKQEVELLHSKYNLVISLSAGIDSRTTLAVARDIAKEVLFFTYGHTTDLTTTIVNRPDLAEYITGMNRYAQKARGTDLSIARDIAAALQLRHICLLDDIGIAGDDFNQFNKLLDHNTYYTHLRRLAKAYLEHLPASALHIRSNSSEIGSALLRREGYESPLTEGKMAQIRVKMGHNQLAIDAFRQFTTVTGFSNILNYDPYDMFLWEHQYGTWLPNVLLESDVAFDTFELFNCRALLQKILSVPLEQRIKLEVHYGIIGCLWPVLLQWPMNEPPFRLQLEQIRGEHNELQTSVRKLRQKLNSSTKESEKLKRQLRALRNSFSFQVGNMLVDAVRKPGRDTILLPYRLIRLFVMGLKKRKVMTAKRPRAN